ncbi:hypothetical protein N7457_007760 [Penicillium paradoxum]|uniref:uncharacterized protein n=1 Tax=Penicillium paradoxum TaxID=176176 RepID=UPI002547FA92|nr:uncharacterized protein N7457_007760 [Penicillium paradoxum]KAJ5772864.1 hypothetical protein N7457_007760 [Penicillium paradoxum]
MGRPPKKRTRADDEGPDFPAHSEADIWPSLGDSQQPSTMSPTTAIFPDTDHLCPVLYWRPGTSTNSPHAQPADLLSGYDDHNHSWRPEQLKQPSVPVFPTSSPWPDFSTVSEATAMPMPFPSPTSFPPMGSLPLSPSTSVSSDSPASSCTCLSYLYLCLSHMTSISSFPVSDHTLCSLYIAARTARDVIRCQICPKAFATGVQNVMFIGTLLTVAADAWLRVSKTDATQLGLQSAPADYIARVLQSPDPAQTWKIWLHQVVRRAVVGGYLDPDSAVTCSEQQSDLLSMIMEIENRQRRWHEPGQHPTQKYSPPSQADQPQDQDETNDGNEYLCLRVVGSARNVITKFNFAPDDYAEGVEPVNNNDQGAEGYR